MGSTVTTTEQHVEAHDHHVEMSFWSKYVFSIDHKIIGLQYMFTGMFMALIGGFFFLGETITLIKSLGILVVALGVVLASGIMEKALSSAAK